MAHGRVTEQMPASCEEVFALLHDYRRRLTWDTLLSAAYLEAGATQAGKGVVSVCVGRRSLGRIALRTEYITFEPPTVAAVKMLDRPPFFGTWAASIRHESDGRGGSNVTYTYDFTARPRWLRFALEPLMARVFRWETQKRLRALRRHLSRRTG